MRLLLIGDQCGAHTVPYIEVKNPGAQIEHEATTSKISDDQLFYAMQRGLDDEEAMALIVNGFAKDVLKELPMEFAVEAQKPLAIARRECGVTERKTLQLRDPSEGADAAPVLERAVVGNFGEATRRDPRARATCAGIRPRHTRCSRRFAKEDFGKYKFTRHTVVGSAILDFVSHPSASPSRSTRKARTIAY